MTFERLQQIDYTPMEFTPMSSAADSPVSQSPSPEDVAQPGTTDGSGQSSRALFAIFVPDTSSLKMCRAFCPQGPIDQTWAAYVAGLVDGDGSIWAQKGRTTQLYPALAIRLGWKGRDILAELQARHGGAFNPESRADNPKHAAVFYWKVQGTKARTVLQMIYPFLRIKRAQAATALHLASVWEDGAKDRYSLCRQLQVLLWTLNRTGPEFALPVVGSWLMTPDLSAGMQQPKFSTTWPSAGYLSNGIAYQQPTSVRRTSASASGSWPTPQAHDAAKGNAERVGRYGTEHGGRNLNDWVAKWPTPSARDWKGAPTSLDTLPTNSRSLNEVVRFATPGGSRPHDTNELSGRLANQIGGSLNPTWVEWLMGVPTGWTDLGPSATRSSRKSRS
jgi:DNA (cytosine-5)-methyltransferase 1